MAYQIHLQYFAAARDLAGCAEESLELPAPALSEPALRELLAQRHARLAPFLARMRFAVNDELHPTHVEIRSGDQVSVLPPVAGGSASDPERVAPYCALRSEALSVDEALRAVMHPGAGGIVVFLGAVRDHAEQGAVSRLDYEAHPRLAESELRRVLERVALEHPGARLSALHRVGHLTVGDLAVVVAASAAHRAQAFAACRAAIDQIKESVPIWKKEWAPDGSALWVNLGD